LVFGFAVEAMSGAATLVISFTPIESQRIAPSAAPER